jgi:hypothetical protein
LWAFSSHLCVRQELCRAGNHEKEEYKSEDEDEDEELEDAQANADLMEFKSDADGMFDDLNV